MGGLGHRGRRSAGGDARDGHTSLLFGTNDNALCYVRLCDLTVCVQIFRHFLLHRRDGANVLQETEASLRLFAERGVLDYANVMRTLFMALLRSLEPGT